MRVPIVLGSTPRAALVAALAARGVRTNAYFDALLPHVVVADGPRPLTLVITTARALGLAGGATLGALLAHVEDRGLTACPLEAALHLRLAYEGAVGDARITVVSPRVDDDERVPRGFYLRHDDEGLWLRAFVASDDWVFDADEVLALAAPA